MKILALAFIMALMFAMIGADLAEDEERYRLYRNKFSQYPNKGGYYPYPSQSDSQENQDPIVYGRK